MEKRIIVGENTRNNPHLSAELVQTASKYQGSVYLVTDTKVINAKSLMGIFGLVFAPGSEITIKVEETEGGEEILESMERLLIC